MTTFGQGLRKLRRQLRYLSGYLDFGAEPIERRSDFGHCQRPVLLLYGSFTNRCTFEVLERRLRRDGYCVFSLDLGGVAKSFNTRGIDDLADFVRTKVERIYRRNPGMGPLTVIGHSKGGLIGTYYVKKLGGWRRTRALVTLGTPHHGTPAAYAGLPFGLFARSLWQMTPMSSFIRRLQRGAWPPGVRFTSMYSKDDLLAPFPSTLIETHGLPYLRNVEVEAKGHREFLYKKAVYDALLDELREGEAGAPVRIGKLTAAVSSSDPKPAHLAAVR
jgi:pimeloyl-ACP methyl ester carboxylesterase